MAGRTSAAAWKACVESLHQHPVRAQQCWRVVRGNTTIEHAHAELASSQPGVPAAAATASRQQSASQPAAPRQTSAAAQPEVKPQPRRRAVVAPAPQPKSLPLGGWALGQGPRDQRQTPVPDLSLHYGKPAYPPAQRSLPQPSSQPAVLTPPPQPPQAAPAPACPASSTSISSAEDAPMQRKRRTARSLSEKEKKKMTEQRRQVGHLCTWYIEANDKLRNFGACSARPSCRL